MKYQKPKDNFGTFKWSLVATLSISAILSGAFLAPDVSAQTLMLKFGFEDTGTTTADSVAGVSLNIVDAAGAAADLHGATGTGVGGGGKALDFTSATGAQTASPLASAMNNAALGFGSVGTWTVTEWVKPVTGANLNPVLPRFFILGVNGTVDAAAANALGAQMENNATSVRISVNNGNRISTGLSPAIALNTWSFVAYTYDGIALRMYSGNEAAAATLVTSVNLTPAQAAPNFGAAGSIFLGNRNDRLRGLKGFIDDMRFYNGAGDAAFVEAVRQSALSDPNVTATTITPTNSPIYAGTPVTLSATFGGTAPFTAFVWQSDGGTSGVTWTNLPGSVTNTYPLNTTGMTAGTYQFRLVVTGAAGSATNTPASKLFAAASGPIIVANTTVVPAAAAVGSTVTASATFGGTQPIAYQWRFTGTNGLTVSIPGATSNVYTIASVQFTNVGSYSLVVSNNPGGVPSVLTNTPATLTVTPLVPANLADLGAVAPVPTGSDISQLNTNGNTKFPDTLNYYDNNNGTSVGLSGQTFTTGNNPGGYAVNGLYLKYGGIEGNHAAGLVETLRFYSMFGSTATLLATCQNTNPAPAIANGDWTQWSGLTNIVLQPSTTYAYSLFVSQSGGNSFEQMGNASNSPSFYSGGEIALIPAVGGTVTFGTSHAFDATFLVNLLSLGASSVNTTPTNLTVVAAGGQLTLSWPADHIGWRLQAQTNALNVGLRSNWADVAGSTTVNQMSFPMNPANGSVFFQLVYP